MIRKLLFAAAAAFVGKKLLEELRAKQGLKTMIVGIGSSEIMAHANKPIRSAEDLKGLKYRTSGAWAEVMRDYFDAVPTVVRSEEHTSELQSLMRISYAVFCLKKKIQCNYIQP